MKEDSHKGEILQESTLRRSLEASVQRQRKDGADGT